MNHGVSERHHKTYGKQDVARYVVLRIIPPLKNSKSHGKQEVDVQ